MNALVLLAPLPLALLLGSAALPPGGVQVVNHSGAGACNWCLNVTAAPPLGDNNRMTAFLPAAPLLAPENGGTLPAERG